MPLQTRGLKRSYLDDRGSVVELADQVEEQLSAGLREKIAEFIEYDEVELAIRPCLPPRCSV